jgi:hypothetical protein
MLGGILGDVVPNFAALLAVAMFLLPLVPDYS